MKFETIPSRDELSTLHTFRFRRSQDGQLYARIDRNVRRRVDIGCARITTTSSMCRNQRAAWPSRARAAFWLSLESARSPIKSRGLPGIEFEIARVASTQINHLVSQTYGEFPKSGFSIPDRSTKKIFRALAWSGRLWLPKMNSRPTIRRLILVRIFRFLKTVEASAGLFFLKARGWDPAEKKQIDGASDGRFILVTDLGLIVKENTGGGRDVFVGSIGKGGAVEGVKVDILGKNGIPLVSGTTDAGGRVTFPSVDKSTRDQRPVAIVAQAGRRCRLPAL